MSEVIRLNENQLKEVRDLLYVYRNGADKAISRAINYGLKQGEMAMVNGIYSKAALTKRKIREHVKMKKAYFTQHQASVTLSSKPLSLIDYGAKTTNNGVTFRIWRTGSRERYKHAFIWTLVKSKYTGVFEWKPGEKGKIRRKAGPRIPLIYQNTPGLAKKANQTGGDAMIRELDRQVGLLNRGLLT